MISARSVIAFVLAALFMTQAASAAIVSVGPESLKGTQVVTFDDLTGGVLPGANYDNILVSGGVSFAERFDGQIRSTVEVTTGSSLERFDALSSVTNGPLKLAVGTTNQNLNVLDFQGTRVLSGLGPDSYPNEFAIGEGSFAALFTTDQSEFGFDLIGGDNGSATLNFFRRDGSLIHQIILSGLTNQSYGFKREGGAFDIAGVSVHNSDPGGIGVDNVRFDVRSGDHGGGTIPEPTSLALAGLALLGLAAARRRKA